MGSCLQAENKQRKAYEHEFNVYVNEGAVLFPDYLSLNQLFRARFSLFVYDQLIWTINESVTLYQSDGNYIAWKSAYNAIYFLLTCTVSICIIPFFVSAVSIILTLFLLFISLFLSVTEVDTSFYLWFGIYDLLPYSIRLFIIGCFVISIVGFCILYFTLRALRSLTKAYAESMGKHISFYLKTLSKLYDNSVRFNLRFYGLE